MNLNRVIAKQFEGEMNVRLVEWGADNRDAIILTLKTATGDTLKARYTEEDYLAYACESIAAKMGLKEENMSLEYILEYAKDNERDLTIFASVVDGYQRVQFMRA